MSNATGFAALIMLGPACATGSVGVDREVTHRASPQLRLGVELTTEAVFPAAVNPRLPSADRIAPEVRARLGETASSALRLCVSPTGRVTDVALVESSGFDRFDAAVL